MHIERSIRYKIYNLDGCATRWALSSLVESLDLCFFSLSSFDMQAQIVIFKKIPSVKETHQEAWT